MMEMENMMDGSVVNFKDFPRFRVKHTKPVENTNLDKRGCYMEVATRDHGLHIGIGSSVRVYRAEDPRENIIQSKKFSPFGEVGIEFSDFTVEQNKRIQIDKFTVVYTERDVAQEQIKREVQQELNDFVIDGIQAELTEHIGVYEKLWKMGNMTIKGDPEIDKAVRFNLFHLMSTASENDDRVNLGAKLMHGEEYRGSPRNDRKIKRGNL